MIFVLGVFIGGNTSYGQSSLEVRTFEGHSGGVTAVAVTPDGRHVVAGDRDYTVKLWNVETGELIRTIEGHTDQVYAVSVTPDGHKVVSGSRDNTVPAFYRLGMRCRCLGQHFYGQGWAAWKCREGGRYSRN